MDCRIPAAILAFVVAAPIAWSSVAARQITDVSLIVANGIVITIDSTRRILNPGSVAINGTGIVAIAAWVWVLISPGMTTLPVASMVSTER